MQPPKPKPQQPQCSKDDLKTPSFIPVLPNETNEDSDQGLVVAQPVMVAHDSSAENVEEKENIEPDSLDPTLNNEDKQEEEQQPQASEEGGASAVVQQLAKAKKPRSRHRQKRYTHSEKRYHSEVRQEAVQQALAAINNTKAVPMASKRSSVMNKNNGNEDGEDEDESSSGSEDEDEEQPRGAEGGNVADVTTESMRNVVLGMSDTSSNNSLARTNNNNNASLVSSQETPPLPSRNAVAVAPPPTRPPLTSPTRQNSR